MKLFIPQMRYIASSAWINSRSQSYGSVELFKIQEIKGESERERIQGKEWQLDKFYGFEKYTFVYHLTSILFTTMI